MQKDQNRSRCGGEREAGVAGGDRHGYPACHEVKILHGLRVRGGSTIALSVWHIACLGISINLRRKQSDSGRGRFRGCGDREDRHPKEQQGRVHADDHGHDQPPQKKEGVLGRGELIQITL